MSRNSEQWREYQRKYNRAHRGAQLKAETQARREAVMNSPQHDEDTRRIAEILCALPIERLVKLVEEKWGK